MTNKNNEHKKSILKVWLVIGVLIFIHSLFPPRVYVNKDKSAGRCFVLSSINQADVVQYNPKWDGAEESDKLSSDYFEYYSSEARDNMGGKRIGYNPAHLDLSLFVVELVALLSIGSLLTLRKKLRILDEGVTVEEEVEVGSLK